MQKLSYTKGIFFSLSSFHLISGFINIILEKNLEFLVVLLFLPIEVFQHVRISINIEVPYAQHHARLYRYEDK